VLFYLLDMQATVDVVIVGGSYAGLSAAMSLGRAIRQVVVIDSGQPCNWQTPHAHNLITHDGSAPGHIRSLAKEQVLAYPTVRFESDTVTTITGKSNDFVVETASGQVIRAKKILLAAGVRDLLPPIEGFAACWGISVIHCPYCHGYEYRAQPTGILVNGPTALDFGKLIRNWTKELTIFTNGTPTYEPEHGQQIEMLDIKVESRPIQQLVHTDGVLEHVLFTDGSRQPLPALYARVPFEQHFPLSPALDCKLTETGLIQTDEFRHTSVPGVYAAGDNSTMLRSVASAIAMGSIAGAMINHELIAEGN
jgi:thioredoxin reductase